MSKKDIHQGLCCMDCQSVFFDIESFLKHLKENPGHDWYKSGKDLVFSLSLLLGNELSFKYQTDPFLEEMKEIFDKKLADQKELFETKIKNLECEK